MPNLHQLTLELADFRLDAQTPGIKKRMAHHEGPPSTEETPGGSRPATPLASDGTAMRIDIPPSEHAPIQREKDK